MCFTETFLKPHEHVESLPLNHGLSVVFRCDRAASEDLSRGGVMIACAQHMLPIPTHIQHYPSLEVVSVLVKQQQLCIVAVYRRPQLPLSTFIPLFSDYLGLLPHSAIPTIILGDFNGNQLSLSLSRTVFHGLKAFQTSRGTTDMRSRKPGGGSPKIKGTMFCVCSDKCEQVPLPVSICCMSN